MCIDNYNILLLKAIIQKRIYLSNASSALIAYIHSLRIHLHIHLYTYTLNTLIHKRTHIRAHGARTVSLFWQSPSDFKEVSKMTQIMQPNVHEPIHLRAINYMQQRSQLIFGRHSYDNRFQMSLHILLLK